ncbi:LOW QUALITY PROTEIN: CD109 antigen-like [Hyperolius riggenbachi]|uniref:LOW QUALITY PROTEIN: CD109 antigen-like n=1 Tax=Hyperolius riggenbachi TaxID=752182 RepID=UPI0035A3D56A
MCIFMPQPVICTAILSLYLLACRASPSYFIAVPTNPIRGTNTSIAVHWFGDNYSDITVTAGIKDGIRFLSNISRIIKKDSIELVTLPLITNSSDIELEVNGSAQNTLVFSNKINVKIGMRNVNVLIQTDKKTYKPGEIVKIRAISVNSYLKPYQKNVDIEIRDPRDNVIQQHLNQTSNLGVITAQLQLANSAMLGGWSIQATADGDQNTVAFSVAELGFLKFDVTLDTPSFYIGDKMQNLTGTVTAKYYYGKPVKGNVTISAQSLFAERSTSINTTYNISGSVNFTFTAEEIIRLQIWGGLNITATVTEELTGTAVKTSSSVRKEYAEYKLQLIRQRPVFTPGLNFTAQLQVQRTDNKPLTKEERDTAVTVIINQGTEPYYFERVVVGNDTASLTVIQQQYTIPDSGIVNLEFPVVQSVQWIQVNVEYQNVTASSYFQKPSTNDPFIQMQIAETSLKIGTPFHLQVHTYPEVQDVYYMVVAKGTVVAAGSNKTTFSLIPAHSWAPIAQLWIYFRNPNNSSFDIVQTSQLLPIKGILKDKVTLSWSKNIVGPSENVVLSASVKEPLSLVGLRVVEKTSALLEEENYLTESKIEEEIRNYLLGPVSTLTDAKIFDIYEPSLFFPYEELYEVPQWKTLIQNRPIFTETWIWQEVYLSSNITTTSLPLKAPNKNTTWVATAFVISEKLGFGITDGPVELTVLKPLFITINMPTSLIRGELFIMEVVLSNSLKEDMQVIVTLESSNSFDVIIPNNDPSIAAGQRNVTVPKEDGTTVLYPIKPKVLGNITITLNATSNVASDFLRRYIVVRAEGVRQYYSQAVLFEVNGSANAPQTVLRNFSFTFPSDLVQGSEESFVTVSGDILGPSINGLESLIMMPYGCGEQNMIGFAPNIYVVLYLTATNQIKEDIRQKAMSFMEQGYQRELQYQRYDASFSAFGNSDASGSTWLSAYVFKCFLQARPFIYISPDVLSLTVEWLIQFQNMNTGEFSEPGRVIHKELQGGQNGPTTLTAYIVTSLLEDNYYGNRYKANIQKAVQYLEKSFDEGISSNYTLSVLTYALTLANSTKSVAALNQLNARATTMNDGTKYWSAPSETTGYWQPRTTDIETAAYALLSLRRQNRIADGIPVMKWLSQQRNQLGGYISSQDTVMALQALSEFVTVLSSGGGNSLTLTVTGPSSFVPKIFQINSNLLQLQRMQIEISQPLLINAIAVGRGLALFQFNVMYNTKASSRRRRNTLPETFSLDISVTEDTNNIHRLTANVCTSYQGEGNETGMVLLQFGLLTGFRLSSKGIPLTNPLKLVEPQDNKVNLYLDSVTKQQFCIPIQMERYTYVAASEDAVAQIYEYYSPTRTTVTRTYNSKTMKQIAYCDFCGQNCTKCKSNVQVKAQTNSASAPTFFMLLFSVVFLSYFF